MIMMRKETVAIGILVLCASVGQADVLFSYTANPDPTTVNWTRVDSGTPSAVTGGTETDGTKYWEINDNSTAGRTRYESNYTLNYNNTRLTGFTYTAKVKVVTDPQQTGNDIAISIADGKRTWALQLRASAVYIGDEATLVKTMDTTDGYHTYQIILDPTDESSVDVYVDGVECLSDYTRNYGWVYQAYFGSSSTSGTSTARYSEVTYETGMHPVPEPATMSLVGLGAVGILMMKRGGKNK